MSYQQPYGQGPPQGYPPYPPQGQGQYPQNPPYGQGQHPQNPPYGQGQHPQNPPYGQGQHPQGPGPYQQGPGSYPPMSGQHPQQPQPYAQQQPPQGPGAYPGQHSQQPGPYPPYSAPQQGMGYPPQQGYPPQRPQQGHGLPPQQGHPQQGHPQQGYPPQQQCQPYPPGPPGQQPPGPYAPYPPGQNYGPPPTQQPMPSRPSPGYDANFVPPSTAINEADALRKAMKGFGTDEKTLIRVLTSTPDPNQMAIIRHTYHTRLNRSLEKDLKSETSGSFEDILVSLATGPLDSDITYLHDAMSGLGTNETALNDVLLGRSNADLNAIKHAYAQKYHTSLLENIKSELSGKTERFFEMLLDARRPEPGSYFDRQGIDNDVRELHRATVGKMGTDEISTFAIFLNSSDERLSVLQGEFERVYHTKLEKVIREEFSGHLEDALVAMLARARDPAAYHARVLKECLFGDGVKEPRLVYWVVRLHWEPGYFNRVKAMLGGELGKWVRGYLPSGDFRDAVLRVCGY
ncbi:Annexin [Aspergillus ibericus CBS 121593]|uniref:Annexin n=1 Tax=Aspergillus ibericus CBS 121593 TaxID=1448316 RepID=A0A395H4Y2_9EURO|nr:Annexin [Aspergillus ibericus CBS 121593]RAL02549.1 Annexin [Aspergillus ibericus CBS 121593]